jgi:uncharacterized protein YebE (UPF0316 family)
MFTYLFIFTFKIIENAISTLRLIVVSKGKKWFGAFLQFLVALIWVVTTFMAIKDLNKDPLKIFIFAYGSFIGSYLGSLLEEKIALGSTSLTIFLSKEKADKIIAKFKNKDYFIYKQTCNINNQDDILLNIFCKKKKTKEVLKIIKKIDNKAYIYAEAVKNLNL